MKIYDIGTMKHFSGKSLKKFNMEEISRRLDPKNNLRILSLNVKGMYVTALTKLLTHSLTTSGIKLGKFWQH